MLLTQLFEAVDDNKSAAFCFGRMNPPTVGHEQLLNTTAQAGKGGDYFIFTSQTQDPKKNPLDFMTKVKFLAAMFPQHAKHIVANRELNTIMKVAAWLYDQGYRNVTFVAGSDRLDAMSKLLKDYNGVEGTKSYYNFKNIDVVSSGSREDGAEGLAGVSASGARAAAAAGDKEAFAKTTGAGKLTDPLYRAVRQGMAVEEGASGYIPKNSKEAKDPRWSMAITKDVGPDTPLKNAKALGLAGKGKKLTRPMK
jgi:nicotinamide mononucleotide adenylyltransferase